MYNYDELYHTKRNNQTKLFIIYMFMQSIQLSASFSRFTLYFHDPTFNFHTYVRIYFVIPHDFVSKKVLC